MLKVHCVEILQIFMAVDPDDKIFFKMYECTTIWNLLF